MRSLTGNKRLIGWVLIVPTIIVLMIVTIYPMIYMFFISFHNWSIIATLPRQFVGIGNFLKMFDDPAFHNSLRLTIIFVVLASVIELALGLAIALLLSQNRGGIGIIRTLFILPAILAPVVVGLAWRSMLSAEIGIVNYFLRNIGLPPQPWLGQKFLGFVSIIIADVWEWTPFATLVLIAGLNSLPVEPLEAALVDGASKWQVFRYITFPLLVPIITVVLLFRTLDAFKVFDTVYMMTGGGPGRATDVFSFLIWRKAFFENQLGYAATLSIILLVVTILIAQGYIRILKSVRK